MQRIILYVCVSMCEYVLRTESIDSLILIAGFHLLWKINNVLARRLRVKYFELAVRAAADELLAFGRPAERGGCAWDRRDCLSIEPRKDVALVVLESHREQVG